MRGILDLNPIATSCLMIEHLRHKSRLQADNILGRRWHQEFGSQCSLAFEGGQGNTDITRQF